jgi:putative membrane protein insertion efficiency factor
MPVIITSIKLLIKFYQLAVSPFLGVNCRFTPSCSHYAGEAISAHGLGKGGILAFKRLLRCQPFAKAGYDPVPPVTLKAEAKHEKY